MWSYQIPTWLWWSRPRLMSFPPLVDRVRPDAEAKPSRPGRWRKAAPPAGARAADPDGRRDPRHACSQGRPSAGAAKPGARDSVPADPNLDVLSTRPDHLEHPGHRYWSKGPSIIGGGGAV